MEEGNHRWRSFSPWAVYTSSILAPAPVQGRPQHNPNPEGNPLRRRKVARESRQHLHEYECQRNKNSQHCNRSEEHTSELQSRRDLVCRLLLEKKKKKKNNKKN